MPDIKRLIFVGVVMLFGAAPALRAAPPDTVEKSLAKGKEWLYATQRDGHWETVAKPGPITKEAEFRSPEGGNFTGRTALAVLALLNSGENPRDPRLKSAIEFLLKTPTNGTYALGIRCQVWLALPPGEQTRKAMLADARILLTSYRTAGNARGMYDYIPNPDGKSYSHSRSQYAVLGMWAAAQMGAEIPDEYWKIVEEGWKRNQDPSGGWTYANDADTPHPLTPGMTTVGIASLFITQEQLRAGEGILCKDTPPNPAIEKGIKWLGANMDKFATNTRYKRDWPYPTLYAYERVGAASGLRYFGGVDWYETGSDWAVATQGPDGSWTQSADAYMTPHVNTCFAMLFLAKGRAPIIFSKLQYFGADGKEARWNQRSRDVAHLTRWMGRLLERELAFQIMDLDASLADLTAAPVLYIAGSDTVNLSDKHRQKLKAFIEAGGVVLASAECGKPEFAKSIKKLGGDLFPDYEFRTLPDNDILYTDYYPRTKWKTKPQVEVLSNGARKLIVLVPAADLAKAWQLQDARGKPEHFELAANLVLHAVDRQGLRYRGDRMAYVPDDPAAKPGQTITVGRIKYAAAWDPEPGGWRRLNNLLVRTAKTAVVTKVVEPGKDPLKDLRIAHLTGTTAFKLSDAQRAEIRTFVEGGGTLLVDAAGGVSDFATSAESELAAIFPAAPLAPLPPEMFSPTGTAEYRSFARKTVGRSTAPRLQGITLKGRLAVVYSREDLSNGLVGQAVDGVIGYTPDSATALVSAILTQAASGNLGSPVGPVTRPAATTRSGDPVTRAANPP